MKRYRTLCVRGARKGWARSRGERGNKEELMTMTEGISFLIHSRSFASAQGCGSSTHMKKALKYKREQARVHFSVWNKRRPWNVRDISSLTTNECQLTMAIWFIKLSFFFRAERSEGKTEKISKTQQHQPHENFIDDLFALNRNSLLYRSSLFLPKKKVNLLSSTHKISSHRQPEVILTVSQRYP